MKKLMILGAGSCQVNAIKRIKSLGYTAIASDYNEDSIGKQYADTAVLADTFSYEETLKAAEAHHIDGIMTSGTDQPVLTVAKVASKLSLFSYLDEETAFNVTNKKAMKAIFKKIGIPTVDYQIINKKSKIKIKGPYVLKPLDSQGQRGIHYCESELDVYECIDDTLSYSKLDEVLLESYYENKEVTVSGWVRDGQVHILTITDRVTFTTKAQLGVCLSHEYPTIHQSHLPELKDYTYQICRGFNIDKGPIYFQFLVGNEGVKVNEIACRIGGAYEDVTIPMVTGVDILSMQIEESLDHEVEFCRKDNNLVFSTQLFFCKPGRISHMTPIEKMLEQGTIVEMGYNYTIGNLIPETENASARAGYMIIKADSEVDLVVAIEKAYDALGIYDDKENLVIRGKRYYR